MNDIFIIGIGIVVVLDFVLTLLILACNEVLSRKIDYLVIVSKVNK
jgi:hypothetical protein